MPRVHCKLITAQRVFAISRDLMMSKAPCKPSCFLQQDGQSPAHPASQAHNVVCTQCCGIQPCLSLLWLPLLGSEDLSEEPFPSPSSGPSHPLCDTYSLLPIHILKRRWHMQPFGLKRLTSCAQVSSIAENAEGGKLGGFRMAETLILRLHTIPASIGLCPLVLCLFFYVSGQRSLQSDYTD